MQVIDGEAVLSGTETVINRLHDKLLGRGMESGAAARAIREELEVRAIAVELSEEFWSWLGS